METFVVGELRKQLSWTDPRTALYHFRTATGSEVDILLEQADGSVAAIEIKASAPVTAAGFAAMRALREQLGTRFRAGVVLYLRDRIVPFGDQLWLAPLSASWTWCWRERVRSRCSLHAMMFPPQCRIFMVSRMAIKREQVGELRGLRACGAAPSHPWR